MGKVRLLVVTVIAVLFLLPSFAAAQAKPPQGTVPAVEGMPIAKAQQMLSSAGFNPMVAMEDVTDQGKGNIVLKQGVPAGQVLPKGSRIPVTVGRYKPPVATPLPQVVGMKAADAQKMLAQQGWSVKMENNPVTDPSKAGSVIQQVPPAGSHIQKQQPVTLFVGHYVPQAIVPNVVGMPLARAQQTMVSAGLNAAVAMEDVTDASKNNVVLKQEISAGKALSKGASVPVTVGRYTPPAPVPVPKAEGMKAAAAQQMLTQQGWKVQTNSRPVNDPSQAGSVVQQVPPAGTKVLQAQQPITLTIGQYQAQTTVPNVLGMQLQKAQQTLGAAGLNAVVTMENVTEHAKNNVVLKQEIPSGKTLTKGTNVPITVGKYAAPAKIAVPNAVGMPAGPAVQMLKKQGWTVNVEKKTIFDAKQNNIVLQQSPAHGTQAVPSQQVVTLTVGSYQAPAVGKGGSIGVYPNVNQPGTINPPIPPDTVRK